ncbi:LysR family transcriptional regulator [Chitinivorax sp. B]|uniref:LysR family transcriptional regulator n=1 Tax=Chitinivorax sp. B TaxID=2502235 RepID=UPI0010F5EE19|nr:LysR family transcriptional regulator [Chitinivorax sp. B]
MDDLNDLFYFAQVVEHGGFAPAGRALNMPKSKLSRRIALLEERLDVRLLNRSTRHFSVTETGQAFYSRCQAVLVEVESAREVIERTKSEPQGVIRLSCPTTLLHYRIGELVGQFMVDYPKVTVLLEAINRPVDVLAEGLDIALRVRFPPLEDSDLVMRHLADSPQRLVASPSLLEKYSTPKHPADLNTLPSLDWGTHREHCWQLNGPDGAKARVLYQPRYVTDDMTALKRATLRGVGVVQLPCMVVEDELASGELIDILPDWTPTTGIVHAVFPSRRGLIPSVRVLIDYLADHIKNP